MSIGSTIRIKISQLTTLYKIYGFYWTIKLSFLAIKHQLINVTLLKSYSQFGEDIFINSRFPPNQKLFYVDIGSNHPIKFNNTYRFYQKNHRGILIEPNSDLVNLSKKIRPQDVVLNLGVDNQSTTLNFYKMYPDVNSTFSPKEYSHLIRKNVKLIEIQKIKVLPLAKILDQYLINTKIDILSVDTEGNDLAVLKSNNWQKFRPHIICVESINNSRITQYLQTVDYHKIFQNSLNSIYETIS